MPTIDPRYNKKGEILSYRIRVSRGRDPITGKQLKPYTMSWESPDGWSSRSINAELTRIAADFERDCKAGLIETKEQRRERLERERLEDKCKVTLRRYTVETFMPRKAATFSQNAIDSYQNSFTRIFKYLGNKKIEDIRPVDINTFLLALQTKETVTRRFRGGGEKVTEQPLSHATILKHYQVLHSILCDAYKIDGVIQVNPMDKVDRPEPRKDDEIKEIKAYSVDEARRILACLEDEPLQWQVIIRLMLDTGCRRGEIAGLRWHSVDFKSHTIKIENNLQYSPAKGVYDTTPKGKKNRTIDVDPDIIALMHHLRNEQKVRTLKDYCFTQADGLPIFPQTLTKHLEALGAKYGIKGLHPHALRHTAASIAITNGADVASVSAKLGHADKSTTLDMYTHADQEAIKRANDIYRKALYQKAE